MHRFFFLIFCIFLVTGCTSGSGYTYFVQPSPLTPFATKYQLGKVKVTLTTVGYVKPGDQTFASAAELEREFKQQIRLQMSQKNILDSTDNEDRPVVDISIAYQRKVNIGGISLAKPEVSHDIVVSLNRRRLAECHKENYTTEYGYLEEAKVNFKMAAFLWNAKDEPRDITLISGSIVNDMIRLGE